MEKTLTVAVCDDEDPALDIISAAVKRVFSTHASRRRSICSAAPPTFGTR